MVIGDGREGLHGIEILRVPREVLHLSRSIRCGPPELVRRLLPVLLVLVTRQACRTADKSGVCRWTARDLDSHRFATDVRRGIALPAPVAAWQVLGIVRPCRHVNEVP